jgi:hypothetical protein
MRREKNIMLVFGEINLLYFSRSEVAVGDSDTKALCQHPSRRYA